MDEVMKCSLQIHKKRTFRENVDIAYSSCNYLFKKKKREIIAFDLRYIAYFYNGINGMTINFFLTSGFCVRFFYFVCIVFLKIFKPLFKLVAVRWQLQIFWKYQYFTISQIRN